MRSSKFLATLLVVTSSALAAFPDCQNGPEILRNNVVCDVSKSPGERAAGIIAEFTLEEKMNNTGNEAPGVPRLGIPPYNWWQEALHGVAAGHGVMFAESGDFSYATSFANPITMGAAFDDDLIEAVATVVSTEARAFSNANRSGLDFWTPNINGYRDPRWGRGMETPGEDPFHLSSYVKHLLLGLEGGFDPKVKKVIATCKHYAGYDLENWNGNNRMRYNAEISTQDLVEYYMPMFQQCVRDSKVGSIMCSYNSVDGVPSCAEPYLLQTVLREHWGWTDEHQYVVSDCDAIENVAPPWHNYTMTPEEAVAISLNAGTDLDCGTFYPMHLPAAYEQGLFNESTLYRAMIRQYAALVRVGYFDPPDLNPYRALSWGDVSTLEAEKLAYDSVAEGIVLLKNDGTLPLSFGNGSSVAVIGDWANATEQLQGNYYGIAPYLHSPLYAAQQLGLQANYALGPDQQSNSTDWPEAIAAAEKSDFILYFGGVDTKVEEEGKDRNQIGWTQEQLDLLSRLGDIATKAKKPFVITQLGNQLDNSPLVKNDAINALLWAGYPGQAGGDALLDLISGKISPAGRLPVTQYPADYVNSVPMTDQSLRPSSTNPGRTYKWYDKAVFPFGFGLHYTNFTSSFSSNLASEYDIDSLGNGGNSSYPDLLPFTDVAITIKNTGNVPSDFVTLLFVSGEHGPEPYPLKELVGYTRLKDIQPGESRDAKIALTLGSLSRVDESGNRVLYPGGYTLQLDVPTSAKMDFVLNGKERVLDQWPQKTT